jgi:hypothetical protein
VRRGVGVVVEQQTLERQLTYQSSQGSEREEIDVVARILAGLAVLAGSLSHGLEARGGAQTEEVALLSL